MLIIPAIDIKNGNCVRLLQGDPERETVYSADPVRMARRFEEEGARLIHVVDLDGAFSGSPVNRDIVVKIARSVRIPIEIGGGIRSRETIDHYRDAGIARIIIGTLALDPDFGDYIGRYPDLLVAGVDARDSMVATHGWKSVSAMKAVPFMRALSERGIREFIYTDISTDGMFTGPNYTALQDILLNVPGISLVASGGISSLDDIEGLGHFKSKGLKGCIVGKAIYDGRIDLAQAVRRYGGD